jgi:outer membrane protein TolC
MSYSDGGDDNIAITLQMNVPIYRKRVRAGISEAKHLKRAAEHQKRREANKLDTMARQVLYEVHDRRRRLETLSSTLTVQAQQIYESLQTAYASATGEATFLDVLQSVRDLLDFELEEAEVTRDVQVAAAELEFVMGGPWAQTSEETEAPTTETEQE